MLAKAYIAVGEEDKAVDAVESSIAYYLNFIEKKSDDNNLYHIDIKSPLVNMTEFRNCIRTDTIKRKLLKKLSDKDIMQLRENKRYVKLLDIVNNISE